jgi:hypothetical protein
MYYTHIYMYIGPTSLSIYTLYMCVWMYKSFPKRAPDERKEKKGALEKVTSAPRCTRLRMAVALLRRSLGARWPVHFFIYE